MPWTCRRMHQHYYDASRTSTPPPPPSLIFLSPVLQCYAAANEVCFLEKDAGRCRGLFARFFWNVDTQQCKVFAYGGCRGNGNNFQTALECQETCDPASGMLVYWRRCAVLGNNVHQFEISHVWESRHVARIVTTQEMHTNY